MYITRSVLRKFLIVILHKFLLLEAVCQIYKVFFYLDNKQIKV